MSKGREGHAVPGGAGASGQREAQDAGAEILGVFRDVCVFVHFQTLFGGCLLLSLYSTMFSIEFFQVSLILV